MNFSGNLHGQLHYKQFIKVWKKLIFQIYHHYKQGYGYGVRYSKKIPSEIFLKV